MSILQLKTETTSGGVIQWQETTDHPDIYSLIAQLVRHRPWEVEVYEDGALSTDCVVLLYGKRSDHLTEKAHVAGLAIMDALTA